MKKMMNLTALIALVFFCLNASGQKISLKEGSLAPLKEEKSIAITFTYDNMAVGKFTKEADYVEKKRAEMNASEPGKGDKWAQSWVDDRKSAYEPKFIKLFTEHSKMTIQDDAKYTMIFHTTFTEPGYNIGISRGNAYINATATIVETANPQNVVAVVTLSQVKGKMPMGSDFATSWRIAESYARAGRELAQKIK